MCVDTFSSRSDADMRWLLWLAANRSQKCVLVKAREINPIIFFRVEKVKCNCIPFLARTDRQSKQIFNQLFEGWELVGLVSFKSPAMGSCHLARAYVASREAHWLQI